MQRHGLTDREWMRLGRSCRRGPDGRPPKDHRTILDALLWLAKDRRAVARPARALRAVADGGDPVLPLDPVGAVGPHPRRAAADGGREGGIDWEVHMVDGTSVRAHRCAAGGKGGGSARRWAAPAAGSAASCTSAATGGAGRWRSC